MARPVDPEKPLPHAVPGVGRGVVTVLAASHEDRAVPSGSRRWARLSMRWVGLRADQRGATTVEYLVLLAVVGLGLIAAARALQTSEQEVATREAEAIAALRPLSGGGGTLPGGISSAGAPSAAVPVRASTRPQLIAVASTSQAASLAPPTTELRIQPVAFSQPLQDPPPPPPPAVVVAADNIREAGDQPFFHFSSEPLLEIDATLARLSPAELQQLLASLTDEELRDWLGQTDDFFDGLSDEERQRLFDTLATSARGDQALRVYLALQDRGQRADFAAAIRDHASPEQQLAFIEAAAQSGAFADREDYDQQALAGLIGSLLEAPDPRTYDPTIGEGPRRDDAFYGRAFGALSPDDVHAILDATTTDILQGGLHGDSFAYDMSGRGARILESASRVTDHDTRLQVFEGTAHHLAEVGRETSGLHEDSGALGGRAPVMDAAGQLLGHRPDEHPDPQTYTRELLADLHGADPAFEDAYDLFAQETIRAGNQGALDPILATVSPLATTTTSGQGGDLSSAKLLGELVGRQQRAAETLAAAEGSGQEEQRVFVGLATANGKEALQLAFEGASSRFLGATVNVLGPLAAAGALFPAPEYSSELPPEGSTPAGSSDRSEQLRDAYTLGYTQGLHDL